MDYIVGAHDPILFIEKARKTSSEGCGHFVHSDRPDFQNDTLDFKTYQLTKDFEYFIRDLTINSKTVDRVKTIYASGKFNLPDYNDSRFAGCEN